MYIHLLDAWTGFFLANIFFSFRFELHVHKMCKRCFSKERYSRIAITDIQTKLKPETGSKSNGSGFNIQTYCIYYCVYHS